MESEKLKTLYFDVEDILMSSQFIMLKQVKEFAEKDTTIGRLFQPVLDALADTGLPVTQAIMHRNEEFIIKHEEFENIVSAAMAVGAFGTDEEILLDSPYSQFMQTLNIINIHSKCVFLYDNIIEETLIKARCENLLEGCRFLSVTDFIQTEMMGVPAGEAGIYTARTKVIDALLEKNIPISIMYPNTLKYLEKYNKHENTIDIANLWIHVE